MKRLVAGLAFLLVTTIGLASPRRGEACGQCLGMTPIHETARRAALVAVLVRLDQKTEFRSSDWIERYEVVEVLKGAVRVHSIMFVGSRMCDASVGGQPGLPILAFLNGKMASTPRPPAAAPSEVCRSTPAPLEGRQQSIGAVDCLRRDDGGGTKRPSFADPRLNYLLPPRLDGASLRRPWRNGFAGDEIADNPLSARFEKNVLALLSLVDAAKHYFHSVVG